MICKRASIVIAFRSSQEGYRVFLTPLNPTPIMELDTVHGELVRDASRAAPLSRPEKISLSSQFFRGIRNSRRLLLIRLFQQATR